MFSFLIQPPEVDLSGVAKISDSKLSDHASKNVLTISFNLSS